MSDRRHRCGRTSAGHDPHFIQVNRASGWVPVTVVGIEGDQITLRLHGGAQRVVRNHDPARVRRLLDTGHTGVWLSGNGQGSLLSIDKGPASSAMVSVTTGEIGECGDWGRPG